MSSNISSGIISSLNSDIEKLEKLITDIGEYAAALEKISDLYKTTEQNMLNN